MAVAKVSNKTKHRLGVADKSIPALTSCPKVNPDAEMCQLPVGWDVRSMSVQTIPPAIPSCDHQILHQDNGDVRTRWLRSALVIAPRVARTHDCQCGNASKILRSSPDPYLGGNLCSSVLCSPEQDQCHRFQPSLCLLCLLLCSPMHVK